MNTMNPKLRRTRTEVHDDLTAPGALADCWVP